MWPHCHWTCPLHPHRLWFIVVRYRFSLRSWLCVLIVICIHCHAHLLSCTFVVMCTRCHVHLLSCALVVMRTHCHAHSLSCMSGVVCVHYHSCALIVVVIHCRARLVSFACVIVCMCCRSHLHQVVRYPVLAANREAVDGGGVASVGRVMIEAVGVLTIDIER